MENDLMHTTATRPSEPAQPQKPVVDPAAWTKEDLARSRDWLYLLTAEQIADLDRAVALVQSRETPLSNVRREDFGLPILGPVLERLSEEMINGRGFVLIRGVPVHRYTKLQSAIAFWGIGTYFGEAVSQNGKGHLLGHVKDLGARTLANPTDRGYQTGEQLPFHCDATDVVGLLCLHPSKSGGESTIVSSVTIHNEMLRRAPELVAALTEPIYRDRRGEIPPGRKPYYQLPVFNYYQGYLTTVWQGGFIRSAQRFEELPRHSLQLVAALDLFGQLCRELAFPMEFERGDIQLLHNYVCVHSRTAFEDYPEAERKRHLLRLWLATPNGRPLPPAFFERYGTLAAGQRPAGGITIPGTVLQTPIEAE